MLLVLRAAAPYKGGTQSQWLVHASESLRRRGSSGGETGVRAKSTGSSFTRSAIPTASPAAACHRCLLPPVASDHTTLTPQ